VCERLGPLEIVAARADGVTIRHERIAAAYGRLAAASDLVLAEGAGGWLAPISATETMADVAEKLALPVLLVVGLRLGCLNHALLTRDAVRAHGLRFAGWIANKLQSEMPLANANVDTLSTRFEMAPLAVVPMGTNPRSEPNAAWADEAGKKLVSP
jgi:dethiobiotin synthetase